MVWGQGLGMVKSGFVKVECKLSYVHKISGDEKDIARSDLVGS